jgi:hypothetical protein
MPLTVGQGPVRPTATPSALLPPVLARPLSASALWALAHDDDELLLFPFPCCARVTSPLIFATVRWRGPPQQVTGPATIVE